MRARILLLGTMAALSAFGQSVVSVRSGLIHFSEGEVFLSDLPVEQKAGKFPEIGEGAELRTEAGRAEVLLTPGMVLRVGPDSSIRMVSASLIDTKVEFRRGSAVIEVTEDPTDTMARIVYRDYSFRFPKRGTFRIDSLPREFRVYDGEAEVSYLGDKTTLAKDHKISLYGGLEAEVLRHSITDGLDEWSMRRDTQLTADNPPPGDLNGGSYDPAFALDPSVFTGLYSQLPSLAPYSSVSSYPYGYPYSPYSSIYGPGYVPGFSTYAPYGFIQPLPIYVYAPRSVYAPGGIHTPGRPVGGYIPPIRMPVRTPVYSAPRPVVSRPVTVGHPLTVGHK